LETSHCPRWVIAERPLQSIVKLKALTWHGKRDVRVDNVPDPTISEPTDAVLRMTTTAICGSDLHLYEVLTPLWKRAMC
jgi:threonine dehydrogenase-like Zn-dependent dehydrogenase